MAGALESLGDPLIDPILALLKKAANTDIAAALAALVTAPDDTRASVLTTQRRPLELGTLEGEGALPALCCYRVRSKASQFSVAYVDHIETLQFVYATPSCDQDLLDERWAILDRVWRIMLKALKLGRHPAHASGADVLSPVGVVRTNYATALKREIFVPHGGLTFPGFIAEIDVTWRPVDEQDGAEYFPALSFDHRFYVDTDGDTSGDVDGTPDVIARAVTEAGEDVPGTAPEGRNFTRPSDWSL